MSEIKLVAFDLDGTALPMMGQAPTQRFCDAVRDGAALGVVFAPFTGRSITTIPDQILSLSGMDYISYSNGGGIYDVKAKSNIYHSLLPLETCLKVLDFLRPMDLPVQIFSDGVILLPQYMVENPQRYRMQPHHLRSIAAGTAIVVEDLSQYLREHRPHIDKVNITYLLGEQRQSVIDTLSQWPSLYVVSSGGVNLEIGDIQTHKGNALRFLADHLGIPLAQVMALGDNDNDAQMLAAAGFGVAVGNASPAARAAAAYITEPQDQDGAAIAIEQFVLNRTAVEAK